MIAPMRLVFALLTTFCLLFQQMAVAATGCMMEMPSATTAVSGHCDEMAPVYESAALCKSHCAPEQAVLNKAEWPQVPFVAMFPPKPDFSLDQPLPEQGVPTFNPLHRSDPPARLRYCRLLI